MAEVLNGHHFLEMDPPWDTQWHAGDHVCGVVFLYLFPALLILPITKGLWGRKWLQKIRPRRHFVLLLRFRSVSLFFPELTTRQTVGNAAFPEWDTEESSGGYASPSSFTQSSYGAALNHSDHMYSILGQFEPPGPASAQATSQGENANLIQASPSPLLQSPAISVRHSQSPSLPGHPNTNPRSVPLNTSFQFNPQYASVPPAPQLFGTTGMLPSSPTGDPQTHNRFQTMRLPDSRTRSRYEASGAPSETLVGSKRRRSFSDKRPKETRVLESTPPPLELSEDERLLIKLKQEQNMPWKDISREFEERLGRPYQVPALQMRYKRLKERLRLWTDQDVRPNLLSMCQH